VSCGNDHSGEFTQPTGQVIAIEQGEWKAMRIVKARRAIGAAGVMLVVGVAASVAMAATTAKNPVYNLKSLKGTITADGSSTVGPYTTAAAELFSRAGAKNVRVTVGISGTGGGFERFCRNETDLSDASRPMKIKEAQLCKDNNVTGWRAFTVANDALTVVVNKSNTWATCLTVPELKKMWEPGSKVNNWKDVRAGFPDVPLKLYGAGTDSGTFDYFTEAIVGKAKASRSDYSPTEDDNVTVQGVAGDRGALGYFGFSYFEENQDKLKALQIQNPKSGNCVAPSIATTQNNTYKPLARPLFIYTKGASFKRKEVQAFLDFIFDNEAVIAKRARFVPLTKAQLKRAQENFYAAIKQANNG
jgi:phosphate transport system substrate-binding protein